MPEGKQSTEWHWPTRLLIADDNVIARSSMKALLESVSDPTSVSIYEAADGREALALAEEVQPDIILTDLQLPGMDGIAAIRTIKQRWPSIRVIVLTMHSNYQSAALAAGADRFLLKGISSDVLLAAIFQPWSEGNQEN